MSEDTIKRRAISVHDFSRIECDIDELPGFLSKTEGIISAKFDEEKGVLYIVYDLEETDYAHIEEILEEIGCFPDDTLWQNLKESFIKFIEENERAHLQAHADVVGYSPMEEIDEMIDEGD
ncbi:hypothetical protein DRQ36_00505 [bacterium]|nr:MAG: hypothetical protein DRQ36_00505 [bacterium]